MPYSARNTTNVHNENDEPDKCDTAHKAEVCNTVNSSLTSDEVIPKSSDTYPDTYPTTRVISAYALYGGAIGGGGIGLFIGIASVNLIAMILLPIMCAFIGFFIGLIPALITGIILAKLQVRDNMLPVLSVGFLASACTSIVFFGCLFFIDNNSSDFDGALGLSLLMGIVGMCSSAIVSRWALPKDE